MKNERITMAIETITPEIAQIYLTRNIVNRKPSKRTINCYADDMKNGRWQLNGDGIRFDVENHLIDGQHRLLACIKSGKSFDTLVVRGLPSSSFATIDNGKARSAGDILYLCDIPSSSMTAAIVRRFIVLCRNQVAMSAAESGGNTGKMSNKEILDVYFKHEVALREAVVVARKCYDACRAFSTSEIGSVYAYLTIEKKYQTEMVADFLEQLADVKTNEFEMLRICRRIFINDKASAIHMVGSVRQALIIKAWNYFVRKKDVTRFAYNNANDKNIWFY